MRPSLLTPPVLVLAWATTFLVASHAFLRWDATPGETARDPGAVRPGASWRLLMVAHPDCPCSRASLAAVRDLLARPDAPLEATALFVGTDGGSLVREARTIPGLRVEFEAAPDPVRDHGARTSGQAFLFDPLGRARYSGGLTDGRGSFAPSAGLAAIRSILGGGAAPSSLPTYGCALVFGGKA